MGRRELPGAGASGVGRLLAPTGRAERHRPLDLLRGVATMGTLFLSAVAYGLPHAAFFNLESPGTNNLLDWIVAVAGEVFVDQKAVAMLGLTYGICVVRSADRWAEQQARARGPALRRAAAMFVLGVPVGMHGLLWEGTTLWFFAFATPALLFLRKRRTGLLISLGVIGIVLSVLLAVELQGLFDDEGVMLGQFWETGIHGSGDEAGTFVAFGTFTLLMSAMTVGLALGRIGIFNASTTTLRRFVICGLGVGLPVAVAGVVWRAVAGYGASVAIVGEAPNKVAAIPAALGYHALIVLWGRSGAAPALAARIESVGQAALTNSIAQTAFGIVVLREYGFGRGHFSRSELAATVLVIWAVQLLVSKPWLERYEYGPIEWLLRCVTYRRRLPFRRRAVV